MPWRASSTPVLLSVARPRRFIRCGGTFPKYVADLYDGIDRGAIFFSDRPRRYRDAHAVPCSSPSYVGGAASGDQRRDVDHAAGLGPRDHR